MTAQLLVSELSSLIQETKRKNQELRTAAEHSLNDLKSLPQTSETQLSIDLRCRPNFVRPFLLACSTRNPKFASSGIVCLQRLIISKGLPDESLEGVLEALQECSSLALDLQLKVLQALPSLLQNYASKLSGKLLVTAFQLCFLLHNNKTAVIAHTAAAALQQLVASTFEKVVSEDGHSLHDGPFTDVPTDEETISVGQYTLDAYQLLDDICRLTEGQPALTLSAASLSENFGLELLESVLSNYSNTLAAHPEQIHICRTRLMPLIIRILSERVAFPTTVRAMRLVQLILTRLLPSLTSECEMVMSLLNHMLDPDAAVVWKRALCLEVFRNLHNDPSLVRTIYSYFDEQEDKRNIIRDHLATLVRLASEKPAVIGVGNQSTVPATSSTSGDRLGDQAAIQAEGLMGSIGAAVALAEPDEPGISIRGSTIRVACIEQLDKSEAPALPASYIYGLALTCVNNFSEGLAKFLLPFTMPIETKAKRKSRGAQKAEELSEALAGSEDAHKEAPKIQSYKNRKLLVNPLSLESHTSYGQISTSGQMVEHCWPALLAACSTFLNATLDSEYYHALIRSFQRFTQVAGLLDLSTPRDAFLTTLGKHSLPTAGISQLVAANARNSPISNGLERTDNQTESDRDLGSSPGTSSIRKRQSTDSSSMMMSTRNLLCLRALLNLGIALGPVLQNSWLIILETLQQADLVLSHASSGRRQVSGHSKQGSGSQIATEDATGVVEFSSEVTAVKTATTRMFESTGDLPDRAFLSFLECLCGLLRLGPKGSLGSLEVATNNLLSPQLSLGRHQRLSSVPRFSLARPLAVRGDLFVLTRLSETAIYNASRLLRQDTVETGWDLLVEVLTDALGQQSSDPDVRVRAASVLHELVLAVTTSQEDLPSEEQDKVRKRGLVALLGGVESLYEKQRLDSRTVQSCDLEIHKLFIDTLRLVLEQSEDSLVLGWDTVFTIITSIFDKSISSGNISPNGRPAYASKSPRLLRSSFGPLQLICSDFVSSVPHSCLLTLLDTLFAFSSQQQDLNISLTTITFFRNVSDFFQLQSACVEFDPSTVRCKSEPELIHLVQTQSYAKSVSALWLCLLLRLTRIANDDRLEVRHSALYTLFSIFDSCGDHLSSPAWRMSYKVILMEILNADRTHYEVIKAMQPSNLIEKTRVGWNETAVIIIKGVSKLITQNLETLIASSNFVDMWSQLIGYYQRLLDREVLDVSTAVFAGTTKILTEIEDIDRLGKSSLAKAWGLWRASTPVFHADTTFAKVGNQESITAYLDWLHQMCRLMGGEMVLDQVKTIIERLRSCVVNSDVVAYSADIDKMTTVQRYALESLRLIRTDIPGALPELIRAIAGFVVLAYQGERGEKEQTYVALSKSAMDLLRSCITDHIRIGQIRDCKLLAQAIDALVIPIQLKYVWRKEGKEPPPWKKATTTAIAILETSIPAFEQVPDDLGFWNSVIEIGNGIISAAHIFYASPTTVPKDQDFDISAYTRVRQLITPLLGLASIPDVTRRAYTASLFHNSIVHAPHPDDLSRPGQDLLQGLQSVHIGRTQDLPSTPRAKLSYLLLDELFHLVCVRESTPAQLRLAQAAAPYLILRAGLTLKAYVLDQPLRGRMPQPWSQKRELLYVLRKLIELDSEPGAIPDAPGIASTRKKHLHRLYGMVVRATEVSKRDGEVTTALKTFLEAVGADFGV